MMKKVLSQVKEGNISTEALAKDLGISRETLNAILETGVGEGYLEKTVIKSGCANCPLRRTCGIESSECEEGSERYVLTSKGKEYLEKQT